MDFREPTDSLETSQERIIHLIRIHGPVARVDLARLVGLTPAAVSNLTSEMIREGWIRETRSSESDRSKPGERGSMGRPKVLIELVPEVAYVIGVWLAVHEIRLTLGDFSGKIVVTDTIGLRERLRSGEDLVRAVGDAVDNFRARVSKSHGECVGIGLAVQGTVSDANCISMSSAWGMRDVEVARPLSRRFRLPVMLMNDANCVAIAVHAQPRYSSVRNLAVLMMGPGGLGGGLFVDGKQFFGHAGGAAELGHIKYQVDGPLCMCGSFGCIESYVADYAIYRDARTVFDLPDTDPQMPAEAIMQAITRLADEGDESAKALFGRAGRALSYGIGNIITTVSPEVLVITGPGIRAFSHIEPVISRSLVDYLGAPRVGVCRIETYPGGGNLMLQGTIIETWRMAAKGLLNSGPSARGSSPVARIS